MILALFSGYVVGFILLAYLGYKFICYIFSPYFLSLLLHIAKIGLIGIGVLFVLTIIIGIILSIVNDKRGK